MAWQIEIALRFEWLLKKSIKSSLNRKMKASARKHRKKKQFHILNFGKSPDVTYAV